MRREKITKQEMVAILAGLLKTSDDLSFLLMLEFADLEKLVSVVRERLGG